MARFALGAFLTLLFPAAAVHTKRTPVYHIPAGLMVFETKRFLSKCALADQIEASQEGLPLPASGKEMVQQWLTYKMHRHVNFTGTWVMNKSTGDHNGLLKKMGVNQVGLKLISKMHYGVGHLRARITHKGNLFTIRSGVIGTPYEEEVSYAIGKTTVPKMYKEKICAEWSNNTKNELAVYTEDPIHKVPALYRYMEGNRMVTKGVMGKSVVIEYWDRMNSKPAIVSLDPVYTKLVDDLSHLGSFPDEVSVESQ